MGLKHASVRHPDVVVMAPALTEAAQSKNFNGLTSPSRLPLALKKYKRLKRTGPSDVGELGLAMNGHPPSSDVTYSINGLAKSLRNEFIPLDKTTNDKEATEEEEEGVDYTLTQIGGFIMNSGPMGDSSENASSTTMGLQKSNEETDPGGFHKEKMTPGEVDLSQHFKNLGEMIASEVLATTGELSCQNVEEILQVISSMDNGSEMEESGVVAGDMTIFERDLFNVVDEIGICSEDKESLIGDRIEDIKTKQFQLKRKCDFLNRRLRKLRTKTVGRHVSSEITGVIEYTNNLLEAANRSRGYGVSEMTEAEVAALGLEPKGASLSAMSLLMRQLDHASTQQASALARSNNSRQCKYFGSGSSSYAQMTNGLRQNRPGSVLPPYKAEVRAEMERVAGELHSQLYMIQSEIDSDVTVTSSGGESCDEFTDYNNQYQQKHPIQKRAAWRWAEDRAAVACRWTWLQAQVADLDYKIRQTTEIKRQLRAAKGAVTLEQPSVTVVNGHGGSDDGCNGSCSRTRGLVRSTFAKRKVVQLSGLHRSSKRAARPSGLRCSCRPPATEVCALCTGRPDPTQPTDPLNAAPPVNERLARLDPAYHPVLSFPTDASQSLHYDSILKNPEWQTRSMRLPPCKSSGVGQPAVGGTIVGSSAAREAASAVDLARQHHRGGRLPAKRQQLLLPSSQLQPPSSAGATSNEVEQLRPKPTSAMSISAQLKRKIARGRRRRKSGTPFERFRPRKKSRVLPGDADGRSNIETEAVYDGGDVPPGSRFSPVPSLTPNKDSKDQFRRKRENSYDIDNIVIPYSIAASTRPEKLHYKEILTPKWRRVKEELSDSVDHKNGIVRRSSHDAEAEEDISDDAMIVRHERCEVEERKKFLSYLKLPNSGGLSRGRSHRRTDSRAESSGANTPDPMSPANRDGAGDGGNGGGDGTSPLTSPPATPLPPPLPELGSSGMQQPLLSTGTVEQPMTNSSSGLGGRRRTISLTRPEPVKSPSQLVEYYETVAPYDRRIFPLSSEVFHKMLSENESGHYSAMIVPPARANPTVASTPASYKQFEDSGVSRPGSPSSFSTDSVESYMVEDPNDPEWTMTQSTVERQPAKR